MIDTKAQPSLKAQDIKIVCAWCGLFIGGKETSESVSHGMCDACAKDWLKKAVDI